MSIYLVSPLKPWFFSVFSSSFFSQRHDVIYIVFLLLSFNSFHRCSSSSCGGSIITPSGIISSPLYSNTSYVSCKWIIVAKKWEKISLRFTSFRLGVMASNCDSYLEILDGKDRAEKYCKGWDSHPKDIITSETNSMTLILKAKNNNGNIMLTFQASFESRCTGLFTSLKDEIVSPNYPGFYPVPQHCSWKIRVPANYVIRLHFLEFNLESTSHCNRDYVKVTDGLNSSSELLGHFCAKRTVPKQIRSTSNTMMLDFKAFKSTLTGRFHFYYAAEPHCGGYFRGSKGRFTSPGYNNPLYRMSSKDCIWTIEVPKGMVVYLAFVTFDVKSSKHCANDYVEILDGSGTSASSKGQYCGAHVTNPPTVRSTKNTMTIKFHRSSSDSGRGFYATYRALDPENPYDKCKEASGGFFFRCSNHNFIQCNWKCDGTDDCGDGSDEQHCNNLEMTKPQTKAQVTSYVVILVSITGCAILIALVIFIVDRLRRKRRSQASSRRRRRRRARLRALDGDLRDMASPPPTYDFAVSSSSCCEAVSFPPTYAESMTVLSEDTNQTISSDIEQTGIDQENVHHQTNTNQQITQEHSHEIQATVEVDCISLSGSPPTSDTSPLIV